METDETLKTADDKNVSDHAENSVSLTGSIVREALESGNGRNLSDLNATDTRKITETENSGASSSMQDVPSNAGIEYVDSEAFKTKRVQIYAEDTGPKFYPVKGNVVTPPIISKNLPEAFRYLPIYGRPKLKADLEEFQDDKIREYVGCDLNKDEFDKLAKYCSPMHLRTGKEMTMTTNVPTFGILPFKEDKEEEYATDGNHLKIVKKLKMRTERDRANLYVKKLKYRGMRILPLSLEESDDLKVTIGTPLEPGKDLLFRIRFYRPFFCGKERNNSRHSVFSNDVIVPGSCLLGTLRERIVCPNDVDLRLDVSDAPYDAPSTTAKVVEHNIIQSFCRTYVLIEQRDGNASFTKPSLNKELFPSGFMFINNVFYVDEREGRTDYSAPIREWARRRGMGDFPKRDINSVRVDELLVKMGHPEVYVHQGNCEHLFTFSEIRLLGAGDPLYASQFPRHSCVLQNQTVYCTTCAEFGAKWLATGCDRVPFDPAFFCDTCFKLYLYNDGKKIGDFKAYSFRGNEINILKPLG